MSSRSGPSGWEPVYRVVRSIPRGRVSTYGDVAALAGMPRAARQVGWALNALEANDDVPWHRVINAKGEVSARGEHEITDLQRALLEDEGVIFNQHDRVDLKSSRWPPRDDDPTPKKKEAKPKGKTRANKARKKSQKKAAKKPSKIKAKARKNAAPKMKSGKSFG